ncbi:MAG TPA: YIP1 family protein [Stenomitos sp.]
MLDSLYQTLFHPRAALLPLSMGSSWALLLLLSITGGLSWAGKLGLGGAGAVMLTLCFLGLYLIVWFCFSAATSLLAQLMEGKGSGPATMETVTPALWPALLFGPLTALGQHFERLAGVLEFVVAVWILVGLVRAIAQVHGLSLGKAALCVLGACALAFFGLGALLGAPVLLLALVVAS